jgi:hypothetical protein
MSLSVRERCDAIEECYEFMLAYAAQGVAGDEESPGTGQLRRLLGGAEQALAGLAEACRALVADLGLQPAARYESFIAVLDRDASDSLAAVQLVLAQRSISSQLVDNLNASIHVRALLTDIFLIDEVLAPHVRVAQESQPDR